MPETDAIVDLLGVLAYGELSAFDHLVEDARLAPKLHGRVAMSSFAAVEFGHYRRLARRISELDADPATTMDPFVAAIETYHSLTAPSTWPEAVVKAYVGDGLAADFYREVAGFADDETAALIRDVMSQGDHADFAVAEVAAAVGAQPAVAGRLALWGRRLVGEAISQTQHVLADRDSLLQLLVGGSSSGAVSGAADLIARIAERHEQRMLALGLNS